MRLNPFARVETIRGAEGTIDGLRIVAPVKGRGLQTTWMARADDPERFAGVRRAVLTALFDAQQGDDAWAAAPADQRGFLHGAGLFVDTAETPAAVQFERPPGGVAFHVEGIPEFHERGVAVLRHALNGDALGALRRYYRAVVAEGFAKYGSEEGEPHRWVLHNDSVAREMHPVLARLFTDLLSAPLKPSFTYLLTYLEGASLGVHRDRPQCEVTAVLQVDFDPEPQGSTPWPLKFRIGGDTESIALALGDLVIFRGTRIEHYREPLTCGRSSTNLAFCFVAEDFAGPLD